MVFDVKQGWEPLCRFLGAPVPDKPFPRLNDTEFFRARVQENAARARARAAE
ncbi:MAG: sulfotransferase [Chloroflexota bacterium]